jgi:hypothetical protein
MHGTVLASAPGCNQHCERVKNQDVRVRNQEAALKQKSQKSDKFFLLS